MRTPNFTRVSDGKPLRRLLICSKKWLIKLLAAHSTPPFANVEHQQRPRQESNLVCNLRRVACIHHTPRTAVPSRGIEPLLHRSKRCVRAGTLTRQSIPTWNRTRTQTLGKSRAFLNTFGIEIRRQDLNLHEPVYKTGALPISHAGISRPARIRTRCVSFGG
jgi:hypothetical protein